MKNSFLIPAALQYTAKLIPHGLFMAAILFVHTDLAATPMPVNLGTASGFAILAGSGITITGAVNTTTVTGDIGTFPTTSITGLGNAVLNGTNHAGDAVTQLAKNDLVLGYNDAAARAANTTYTGGFDLVGLTLASGVYSDMSSLFLSGTLTLDAKGNPDAVWIFQTGSTLITASNSAIDLIGGAQACHVFWQVGSSATLGTGTDFVGNILAMESITLNTDAAVDGRALGLNGAVTMNQNVVTRAICDDVSTGGSGGQTVPETGHTILLLGFGIIAVFGLKLGRERQVLV